MRRRLLNSSMCFFRPAKHIVQPTAIISATTTASCGSSVIGVRPSSRRPSRVGMCPKVQLPTPAVRYVRVQLGGREVGMAEHLLDAAEVGAALEQVGRERMAEKVRVDAGRLQPGLL